MKITDQDRIEAGMKVILNEVDAVERWATRVREAHASGDLLEVARAAEMASDRWHDASQAAIWTARRMGTATWAEIGAVFGISKQAAFQRFKMPRNEGDTLD